MDPIEPFISAFRSIKSSKTMSFLTTLGILIAVAAVIINISIRSTIEITVTRANGEQCTRTFSVKGILINESGRFLTNPNINIYIPESTLSEMLDKKGYTIQVRAESTNEVNEVKKDIKHRLDRLLGFTKYSREEPPYNIPKSLGELVGSGMGKMEKAAESFKTMLLSIALISLLVGAIGIMNIMFVTVTERTREVGLMKAVGATRFDVLITFLVESAMLGLIGGAFGVAAGVGFCKVFQNIQIGLMFSSGIQPVTPPEWIFIGFGVSVAVGIVSAFYPAYKAARMKPLEALRYE